MLLVEKKHDKMIRDMEDVISTYLIEMKDENEKFLQKVKEINLNRPIIAQEKQSNKIAKEEVVVQPNSKVEKQNIEDKPAAPKHLSSDQVNNQAGTYRKAMAFQASKAYKKASTREIDVNLTDEEDINKIPPLIVDEDINNITPLKEEMKFNKSEEVPEVNIQEKKSTSDLYMQSLLNQVLLLKKQGFNEEEIARKLNKGKTEIELLLKFRQISQE
ncbi:hypothetical protein ACFYKX_00565 [Cytobacillus sp. FJAT-54145]|uniref:UBA domain-containing protein n=1 Tax=Cytobacillus spartinae TaxID=3299023 RepID=A0ABW6K4K3_9BACI